MVLFFLLAVGLALVNRNPKLEKDLVPQTVEATEDAVSEEDNSSSWWAESNEEAVEESETEEAAEEDEEISEDDSDTL